MSCSHSQETTGWNDRGEPVCDSHQKHLAIAEPDSSRSCTQQSMVGCRQRGRMGKERQMIRGHHIKRVGRRSQDSNVDKEGIKNDAHASTARHCPPNHVSHTHGRDPMFRSRCCVCAEPRRSHGAGCSGEGKHGPGKSNVHRQFWKEQGAAQRQQ